MNQICWDIIYKNKMCTVPFNWSECLFNYMYEKAYKIKWFTCSSNVFSLLLVESPLSFYSRCAVLLYFCFSLKFTVCFIECISNDTTCTFIYTTCRFGNNLRPFLFACFLLVFYEAYGISWRSMLECIFHRIDNRNVMYITKRYLLRL